MINKRLRTIASNIEQAKVNSTFSNSSDSNNNTNEQTKDSDTDTSTKGNLQTPIAPKGHLVGSNNVDKRKNA